MSVITKVFVVLLTLFSIVFAVATVSFVARQENWKRVALQYRDTALSQAAQTKIAIAQMKLQHEQDLIKIQQLNNQVGQLSGQVDTRKAESEELKGQNTLFQSQLASLSGSLKGVEQTLKVTQAQLVSEQDFARKLATRNNELERRNIDLNDRTKELTTTVAMAHAQNRAYLEQISAMEGRTDSRSDSRSSGPAILVPDRSATVQAHVPSAAPAGGGQAVAPIRGSITDIRGALASISVGAADGVTRGMSFMIYRPGASGGAPEYVATVEVTRVEANQAAGQVVRKSSDIKVGDSVRDEMSFARR